MVILILMIMLITSDVYAQPLEGNYIADINEVPFGSVENYIELEVIGVEYNEDVLVTVTQIPNWLSFSQMSAEALPREGVVNPLASLSFDVLATALIGEPFELVLEVHASQRLVATHTIRLLITAPPELTLSVPYPNPSRGSATVSFELPSSELVRVSLLDVLGREVTQLIDSVQEAGAHQIQIGRKELAPGLYFIRLVSGDQALTRSVTIIR